MPAYILVQVSKYEFIPGMQQLLQALQGRYEMHVISNYPVWYKLIEGKLQLSQLLPWTFVSCDGVMQVGSFSLSKDTTHVKNGTHYDRRLFKPTIFRLDD